MLEQFLRHWQLYLSDDPERFFDLVEPESLLLSDFGELSDLDDPSEDGLSALAAFW
jgi:hypothetical protein